ncbi:MAG: histidinol dehydrogenase [Spirochaetaceae bacterium]|jgi:histidinol dehydrogenase|nr:histidinol dehydrogenase [Spirochaetaceae bacterium]
MKTVSIGLFNENFRTAEETQGGAAAREAVRETVRGIIRHVRENGAAALREYGARFDHAELETFEVAAPVVRAAFERLRQEEPALWGALTFASASIHAFARLQKEQVYSIILSREECIRPNFIRRKYIRREYIKREDGRGEWNEWEKARGMFVGQRILPLDRAAVYVPRGRYPLISTVLMGVVPAVVAGVREICVTSAPLEDGLPDYRIMAAAYLAGAHRVFAIGGAQAIAAFALGVSAPRVDAPSASPSGAGATSADMVGEQEIVPRADIIVGPGNKYVAEAKRQLFGEVGIEAVAGPTDVLIIADKNAEPELVAADLIAQAEHDVDARARALVPDRQFAGAVEAEVERQLELLPSGQSRETARASLDAGGLLIVYEVREEAIAVANRIAPEHLELHVRDPARWIPALTNYGSLFIGSGSAEALGDYSAGINHTLPTMGSSRFVGGLSVRHFLKIVTSLRCEDGANTADYLESARIIAEAEGLYGHAQSLALRQSERAREAGKSRWREAARE